jgi:beta-phosphoglucomutase family hydrolase
MVVLPDFDAVLFDLDGVLTPTAEVHKHAWAALFGRYLADRGVEPAYRDEDYYAHIDGKPRYEGVRDLLASRGLELPWGSPGDSPGAATVAGLGNRKNAVFTQILEDDGVTPYPGTRSVLDALAAAGKRLAVVSSSQNARAVLAAAGLLADFPVVVDGLVAAERGIAGKPAPDTFAFAAAQLGVPDARAVVVEDAVAGVAAGRAGGFGLVVGVDRGTGAAALRAAGADIVIDSLTALLAP